MITSTMVKDTLNDGVSTKFDCKKLKLLSCIDLIDLKKDKFSIIYQSSKSKKLNKVKNNLVVDMCSGLVIDKYTRRTPDFIFPLAIPNGFFNIESIDLNNTKKQFNKVTDKKVFKEALDELIAMDDINSILF